MRLDRNGRGFYCGYEFVNLQLEGAAKNLLFATCNLGAEKETDCGDYYQFGCTEPCLKTYKYFGLNSPPCFEDVCKLKMGGMWRMPTIEELQALIAQTSQEEDIVQDVKGIRLYKYINGTKRFLFIPLCGFFSNYWGKVIDKGHSCYIWSSSKEGKGAYFNLKLRRHFNPEIESSYGHYGQTLRGVFKLI